MSRSAITTAALFAAATTAAVLLLPLWAGLVLTAAVAAAALAFAARTAAALRRTRSDAAAKLRNAELLGSRDAVASSLAADPYEARIALAREALEGGFPDTALKIARRLAADPAVPYGERFGLLHEIYDWHVAANARPLGIERTRRDIVLISDFTRSGGALAARVDEIRAFRSLGLSVGLVHNPVFDPGLSAPPHDRIEREVDGTSVAWIGAQDAVECDLAVVRLPETMTHPLEVRPGIEAKLAVAVADQTPMASYGRAAVDERVWDIGKVSRNIRRWLGPHLWYAGGPNVYRTLEEHHAAEIAGLDLAFMPWNECIDVERWRLPERRVQDGPIRIGRHSRDHRLKWPEDAETLAHAYPGGERFEIRVLGGAEAPKAVLGELPGNWTALPFGSQSPERFLAELDLFVYFDSGDHREVFGRAPLEAMAAGVPVIMDPKFKPTFGPAAVYCEPAAVAAAAERLMADPDAYAAQQEYAWTFLGERFSADTLAKRLALLGVASAAQR